MLEGVVKFPPEYAKRYRERGYWLDKSIATEFAAVFARYTDRVALIDGERRYRYADVDRQSDNLALNLLVLGMKPLDRVVLQLPNVAEFVILYFALQKIGAIPIAALATHRYNEVSQFVDIAQAVACVYPERQSDFAFGPMIARVASASPCLKFRIVLGTAGAGELSLTELIERPATLPRSALDRIELDPTDPCIFQLSGGTTGVPKLIPRTHNDYAYNSKTAAQVCGVTGASVLLLILPIAHNLPLACPGIQGFFFNGGNVVLSQTTRPEEMFRAGRAHRVTHIKVVPALLIRLINSPAVTQFDTVVAALHPERRPAHAARGAHPHQGADPERVRAGELRHVGRHADVRAAGRSGRGTLETCRPADLPGRRGAAGRRRRQRSAAGRGGRVLLPRPLHAARLLRRARVQRQGSSRPTASIARAT